MLCVALIALLFFVFPLRYFFPVDPETAGDPQFDYGVDDPSLPEQPVKPPFDHQISPILLYTACIRVGSMLLLSVNPILMHSLSLLLQSLTLPAILLLSIGCECSISGPTLLSVCHAILLGRDHFGRWRVYTIYNYT